MQTYERLSPRSGHHGPLNLIMKLKRTLLVTVALTIATAAGGTALAVVSTVTATTTDTIVTHGAAGTNLSPAGGVDTTILTVQLPQGKWVLTAYGDLVNFGPSDYTRCVIFVGTTQVAATSTIIGDPSASGSQGPAGFLAGVSLAGGTKVGSAGATATLQCSHDNSNGAAPYFDGNGSMWAHKTSSLQVSPG